ncbi:MAG: hypothetical protein QOJ51_1430, partial [Acidobacteriaceae bacterium]|nr:hypothetical protein [Acidobacteriaceae bacterium]
MERFQVVVGWNRKIERRALRNGAKEANTQNPEGANLATDAIGTRAIHSNAAIGCIRVRLPDIEVEVDGRKEYRMVWICANRRDRLGSYRLQQEPARFFSHLWIIFQPFRKSCNDLCVEIFNLLR